MSDRRYPDLTNALEWDLVDRQTNLMLNAATGRIDPKGLAIANSFLLAVGVKTAGVNFLDKYTGGWVAHQLNLPDFASNFPSLSQVSTSKRLRLGVLNLVDFSHLAGIPDYQILITFPRWLNLVEIEIWRYLGQDLPSDAASQVAPKTVPASTIAVLLLPANSNRRGASITNAGTGDLYVNLGSTASAIDNVAMLVPNGYYEIPYAFTGEVWGVWTAAIGNAQIDEFL